MFPLVRKTEMNGIVLYLIKMVVISDKAAGQESSWKEKREDFREEKILLLQVSV